MCGDGSCVDEYKICEPIPNHPLLDNVYYPEDIVKGYMWACRVKDLAAVVPVAVATLTPFPLLTALVYYNLKRKYCSPAEQEMVDMKSEKEREATISLVSGDNIIEKSSTTTTLETAASNEKDLEKEEMKGI